MLCAGILLAAAQLSAQDDTPDYRSVLRAGVFVAPQLNLHSGNYDVVMLDEVNVAVGWKLVKLEDVLQLVKDKPEKVELILTGRRADPALVQKADLVTEMVNIKHPYEKGIQARQGIEF